MSGTVRKLQSEANQKKDVESDRTSTYSHLSDRWPVLTAGAASSCIEQHAVLEQTSRDQQPPTSADRTSVNGLVRPGRSGLRTRRLKNCSAVRRASARFTAHHQAHRQKLMPCHMLRGASLGFRKRTAQSSSAMTMSQARL